MKIFVKSILDDQSLYAIHDSNLHTQVETFCWRQTNLKCMNDQDFATNGDYNTAEKMLQIKGRKKVKMLHALQDGSSGRFDMQYLK